MKNQKGQHLHQKKEMMKTTNKEVDPLKVKGIIAAFAAVLILVSYIVYSIRYYEDGVKLNEMYFISQGIGISVFTGLQFTLYRNIYVRTILLFTSVYYAILEAIYIIVWIYFGQPYSYIKHSLLIGLVIGIIYFLYDKFNNNPRNVDHNSIVDN